MLIGFLIFIILVLSAIVFGLVRAVSIQIKKNEVYEDWIVSVQDKVEGVYSTMKELDNRQIFSKDDEVGVVFQQMVELISYLNQIVSKE